MAALALSIADRAYVLKSGVISRSRNAAEIACDPGFMPDCFIINIGDLLAHWTNIPGSRPCIESSIHNSTWRGRTTQSLVFFHNPNNDAEISCIPTIVHDGAMPKYAPTISGGYLRSLFVATQNA